MVWECHSPVHVREGKAWGQVAPLWAQCVAEVSHLSISSEQETETGQEVESGY